MRLQGRVVFLSGASRGVGRACALACAREGASVVVAARTEHADNPRLPGSIHTVAREIEALGREALAIKLDVRDDKACEAAIAKAMERFGRLDALVNNASALWTADVLETPTSRFDQVMSVNLRGAFALSRAALPHMIAARSGQVVMMSPPIDASGVAHHGAYAVSKLGMTLLAQAIAEEVRAHDVTAHALWPATAIESVASLGLGAPELCRKPEILGDALVALLAVGPAARPGGAWIDEELLRADGVVDFAKYQCVPGVEPPQFPFSGLSNKTVTR